MQVAEAGFAALTRRRTVDVDVGRGCRENGDDSVDEQELELVVPTSRILPRSDWKWGQESVPEAVPVSNSQSMAIPFEWTRQNSENPRLSQIVSPW